MPSAAFMKALANSQKKVAKAIRDPKTAGTIKYVKTSSPRLNGTYGSGKGIAIGRIHRLMGPESGGKTAICTFVQKEFQQKLDVQHPELGKKPISVWIDFEGFDNAHATEMGLDTTSVFDGFDDKGNPIWNKDGRFLLVQPDSIEDAGVAIEELVRSGEVGSIVFDSESLATTRTIQENEMGKACVAPNTLVNFYLIEESLSMTDTVASLFKAAGYEDYKSLPVMEFVKPKNKIFIASYENGKKVFKEVTGLIYKGEADSGYKVISKKGIFLGTKDHAIFNVDTNKFERLEDAFGKENFNGINEDGEIEPIIIEKCTDSFSILDFEVEGTHTYFSAGILSHNTFGGKAKMLGEFLTKFNILCRNYDTTMFIISQERANMAMGSHAIVTTGGYSLRYAASTLNRVKKVCDLKDGTGKMIGIQMNVRNYKNKTGIPFRENDMWLYFDRGFDAEGEYIDLVKELQTDSRITALCKIGGAYWKSDKWGWSYKSKDSFISDFVHNEACKDMWEEMKNVIDEVLSGAIESDKETGDPEQMAEQNETYMDSAEARAEINSYKEVEQATQDSIVKKEDGLVTESETPEVTLSEVD